VSRRHPGWTAALLLLAALAVLFRDAAFGGRVFFERDVHLMWYTHVETFVRAIADGAWPVWDPHVAFGQPLWADGNNQLLYPPTWLHLALRPWTYYTLYVFAHLLLAGTGLERLARRLGSSPLAALAAALAWVLSGPLLSTVPIWNQLGGAAWVPWIVVAGLHALGSGRVRAALAWGALQALPVLAGSPEMALVAALLTAACAWAVIPAGGLRRKAALTTLAVVVALATSAGQWLPALDVASRSQRAHLSFEERAYWSVHPAGALQMLLPLPLHRMALRPEVRAALFESREPLLPSLYLSLPLLGLVGAGLLASPRPRLSLALAIVAGGLLVVALGRHTPAFGALTASVAPLRALRYPVKVMIGVSLCWALLAGAGVDAWCRMREARGTRWILALAPLGLATLGAALAAAALARSPGARVMVVSPGEGALGDAVAHVAVAALAGALVIALAAVAWRRPAHAAALAGLAAGAGTLDLAWLHDALNPTAPRAFYTARPAVLDTLPAEGGRVYVYDYFVNGRSARHLGRPVPFAVARAPEGWAPAAAAAFAMRESLFPPVYGAFGLDGSFDSDTAGLAPAAQDWLSDVLALVEGTPAHTRMLQLGGVSHVLAHHSAGFEDLELVRTVPGLLPEPLRVYRVPDPLPRVFAVGRARELDGPTAVGAMLQPSFDPRREVLLPDAGGGADAFAGSAALVEHVPDRVVIDAELAQPGWVVLLEGFDPGWTGEVDGRPAPVLRGNVAFRAVAVPAGRHRVTMVYRPRALRIGLALSGAAALALGAAAFVGRRRAPEAA
jgi:hypothetical protein